MFGSLKALAAKGKKLNQDKMMSQILKSDLLQAQIIDLNQKQLYEQGLQADGTPTGDYAYNTIHGTTAYPGKIEKGQRYDHITGKDTGKTYDSMKVKSVPEGIVITANDRNNFFATDAPHGLGLTRESIGAIIPEVRLSLVELIRETLLGETVNKRKRIKIRTDAESDEQY